MEKTLPKKYPEVVLVCLLNGMNLMGQLPVDAHISTPDKFKEMEATDKFFLVRPWMVQFSSTGQGGQLSVNMQQLGVIPYQNDGEGMPFFRNQCLYMIIPKDNSLIKTYLSKASGDIELAQAIGPAAGALIRS